MDIVKEERQRNEFRDLLFSLADSQKILQSSSERVEIYTLMDAVHPPRKGQALRCALGYKQLEGLYYSVNPKEAFRHYYSDIFSVLSRIQQGDQPGSIDVLGQNLMELRKRYKPVNYDSDNKLIDISDNIRKLYDHVSLDIARMGYSDTADRRLLQEDTIENIQGQIDRIRSEVEEASQIRREINEANQQIEKFEDRMKDTQKEYIAILGIFAGIVITFMSAVTFSASVLENMHQSSIYRVVLVTLLIGVVFTNIVYGLFYYIDRVVREKKEHRLFPFIWVNVIWMVLIALTVGAWLFGLVEKRNMGI